MIECRKHFAAFFPCEKEILLFLRDKVKVSEKYEILLSNENFIALLAFITYILTQHFEQKTATKGSKYMPTAVSRHIEAFRKKWKLLTADLHKNVVTHFPSCQTLLKEGKSMVFGFCRNAW